MISTVFDNILIKGVSCCVPTNVVSAKSFTQDLGKDRVDRFIKMTGIVERHIADNTQTASDLAYIAAKRLIDEKSINVSEIGVLIFVSQTPDYITPSTAFILQNRLGLSKDAICFDINMACSGFAIGFVNAASLLNSGYSNKALLLIGDTLTRHIAPRDWSVSMLFGDAGSAILVEKGEQGFSSGTAVFSDGYNYKMTVIPSGGSRNPNCDNTRTTGEDGNERGPLDFYMDGSNVFFFSTSDVSDYINEYMENCNALPSDYDSIILHQANEYILRTIAKKVGFSADRVPKSLGKFGNTVGSSIPITLSEHYGESNVDVFHRVLMCGFGTGLSCGIIDTTINERDILPVFESDEYYMEAL